MPPLTTLVTRFNCHYGFQLVGSRIELLMIVGISLILLYRRGFARPNRVNTRFHTNLRTEARFAADVYQNSLARDVAATVKHDLVIPLAFARSAIADFFD